MDALLDLAIPPDESRGLPGAGSLGLSRQVVEALRADPMLGPMVGAGTEAIREASYSQNPEGLAGMPAAERKRFIQAQSTSQPFLMMGLLRYLYPAYYQQPQVLEAIGEPARPPFPEGFEVEPTDPELLKKLEERRQA